AERLGRQTGGHHQRLDRRRRRLRRQSSPAPVADLSQYAGHAAAGSLPRLACGMRRREGGTTREDAAVHRQIRPSLRGLGSAARPKIVKRQRFEERLLRSLGHSWSWSPLSRGRKDAGGSVGAGCLAGAGPRPREGGVTLQCREYLGGEQAQIQLGLL